MPLHTFSKRRPQSPASPDTWSSMCCPCSPGWLAAPIRKTAPALSRSTSTTCRRRRSPRHSFTSGLGSDPGHALLTEQAGYLLPELLAFIAQGLVVLQQSRPRRPCETIPSAGPGCLSNSGPLDRRIYRGWSSGGPAPGSMNWPTRGRERQDASHGPYQGDRGERGGADAE